MNIMKKINIRRTLYHIRHRYLTLNNVVIAVAFLIAASWIWGSLSVMQRNYALQKEVDYKKQQLKLTELETTNLQLRQSYYRTAEYQELAVRKSLGLGFPGERQLILPANSQAAIDQDAAKVVAAIDPAAQTNNLEQWINFLFGGYSKSIDSK